MKYPARLLPNPSFKVIDDSHKISDCCIAHFTTEKNIRTPSGKLNPEFIVRNHDSELRDYSNNLLGVFKIEDNYIAINSKSHEGFFVKLWNQGEEVIEPKFKEDFYVEKSRGCFFLKVANCLKAVVPFEDLQGTNGRVTCSVIHTPTNSNFWHVSLRWYYNDEDINDWGRKQRKGTQRRILTSAKAFIVENAFFDLIEASCHIPDESCYTS